MVVDLVVLLDKQSVRELVAAKVDLKVASMVESSGDSLVE